MAISNEKNEPRNFTELLAVLKETTRSIVKENKRLDKVNERIDKEHESLDKLKQSIVKQNKSLDKVTQNTIEMGKNIDKLQKSSLQYGSYIKNESDYTEDFFRLAIEKNGYRIGDIVFEEVQPNTKRGSAKRGEIEVDGLLINGDYAGVLEVKTTLHLNDIEKIKEKIPLFRAHFKEFADKKLVVVVAGKTVHKTARDKAHELGFVVLTPNGQKISVDNSHQQTY
jgi:cell division protein FtsB